MNIAILVLFTPANVLAAPGVMEINAGCLAGCGGLRRVRPDLPLTAARSTAVLAVAGGGWRRRCCGAAAALA